MTPDGVLLALGVVLVLAMGAVFAAAWWRIEHAGYGRRPALPWERTARDWTRWR